MRERRLWGRGVVQLEYEGRHSEAPRLHRRGEESRVEHKRRLVSARDPVRLVPFGQSLNAGSSLRLIGGCAQDDAIIQNCLHKRPG